MSVTRELGLYLCSQDVSYSALDPVDIVLRTNIQQQCYCQRSDIRVITKSQQTSKCTHTYHQSINYGFFWSV